MDFKDEFDIISEKAKQLTDTGIRKADEFIGISKLKLRCAKIDALIKAKYTELGRTMYGMVKNDSSDADRIAQAVMDIDHLYKKMAQCNARIELMKKLLPAPCAVQRTDSATHIAPLVCSKLVSTDEEPEDYAF
ncbi:MAG: hypothetical protein ACLTZI_11135 [[Eubacterium] siraeum]